MPLVYTDDYDLEFITINPHVAFLYVESHKEFGGGRMIAVLRGHLKGIPITLRENYTDDGYLREETQSRDKTLLLKQFKKINDYLWSQTVYAPISPFQRELEILETFPRSGKDVIKKNGYIRETFS